MTALAGFLRRDVLSEVSYRLSFALQLLGLFPVMLMFYFLSGLMGEAVAGPLRPYGGAYFPFVLIGIVLERYQSFALTSFSSRLRESQLTGTLEAVLATPVPLPVFLAGPALYSFGLSSLRVVFYLASGALLFGVRFQLGRLLPALLVLALTVAAVSGIGILSASFVALFKKGDPVGWAFSTLSWLLGGVYYPVSVLPDPLRAVAAVLPMTHALEALRICLLGGGASAGIGPHLAVLAAWSFLGLPASGLLFRASLARARARGTLGHF